MIALVKPYRPTLEGVLHTFQTKRGLFILGAGASAGFSPLGGNFWREPAIHFGQTFSSLSANVPPHDELTRGVIEASTAISHSDLRPHRSIRTGTELVPLSEIFMRLPDLSTRMFLKNRLATANFKNTSADNYRVFSLFRPGIIANYNHDGLAERICYPHHSVLTVHGNIPAAYGSGEVRGLSRAIAHYHLPVPSDGLLMGIKESSADPVLVVPLRNQLNRIARINPDFIAIVGYSFAKRSNDQYDDDLSLESFVQARRAFSGDIFVVDPNPMPLQEMLQDRLELKSVLPVSAYWNLLAHAALNRRLVSAPVDDLHRRYLDNHGSSAAWPSL